MFALFGSHDIHFVLQIKIQNMLVSYYDVKHSSDPGNNNFSADKTHEVNLSGHDCLVLGPDHDSQCV